MHLTLRYGRNGLDVSLPDRNVAHVLRLNPLPPLDDPRQAVADGLRQPTGSAPLADLARGRRDAVIVVSDLTRPVPNALLLPPLLETLAAAGLPPERILLLVATGLHRGNTTEELAEMLGPEVMAAGIRIANHAARDTASHLDLGLSPRGIPVRVDRRYVEADLKILTGLIEPHLMAGYSGGRKAICPGLCGAETIMAWHSPPMLDPPEACAGNLWRNPVHQEALTIADLAGGADFIVNAVLDETRQVTGVYCGDMRQAHLAGMEQAERQTKVVVPEPVDIVLTTSAGYPLDLTFYQGVKGMVAALPILKPGGTLIIAQENAEGIGGPEFTELILGEPDLEHFMARAFRGELCVIDQWQLQEMQKVTCRARLLSVCGGVPAEVQRNLFVEPFPTVEAAVAAALTHHGPAAQIAVIPEGPYVLACLPDDLVGRQTVREMGEG
jgi:nickel-dependent lactate racemase